MKKREIENLKEQLASKEKKISELLQFFIDGKIGREYVDSAAAPLQSEAEEIKERLAVLSRPYNEQQRDLDEINLYIKRLKNRVVSINGAHDYIVNDTRCELLEDVRCARYIC